MLLSDENVWDGSLVGDICEGVLNGCAIICHIMLVHVYRVTRKCSSHTDLIKLDGIVLCAHFAQKSLGSFAVRAVRLAEDSYIFTSVSSQESG